MPAEVKYVLDQKPSLISPVVRAFYERDPTDMKVRYTEVFHSLPLVCGSRGGLIVSTLDSGVRGLGSSPGRGHCVVFLGKTLYSHSASLHPGV